MKIYFAGVSGNTDRLNILIQYGFKNFMWSYIAPPSKKQFEILKENNCNLLLDSGAYSAWKKGKEIDVYKYIEYIKKITPFLLKNSTFFISPSYILL